MTTCRTPEAIAAEVSALEAVRPNVRKFTIFGDNNYDAIRAQVIVLTEGLSVDGVNHAFGEDGADGEREFPDLILHSALSAAEWLAGDEDSDPPSEGWGSLAQPQGASGFVSSLGAAVSP